ncbi:MAG: tyrosine-type recombinase/integrase [Eubacteriales bacterium]|nr:tyrosine-type recombinase/integrase [Eubacteriales bacterium]
MEYIITESIWEQFRQAMKEQEKSAATQAKYVNDLRCFCRYLGSERTVTKETVIAYKEYLAENYAKTSANSMLAAINYFFSVVGWLDCKVRMFKLQREIFRASEKNLTKQEYFRLLETAKQQKNERLYLLMQTICGTGIRVSELQFITVEALRTQRAAVSLKGKSRIVLIPKKLCQKLKAYAKRQGILRGSVFVTKSGKPMDRSNIAHEMKRLCTAAGVAEEKVFPHNLRHLFAVTFYQKEGDLCYLADILGHANINTTRIYTRVSCEEQGRRLERLGLVS